MFAVWHVRVDTNPLLPVNRLFVIDWAGYILWLLLQ